MVKIEANESIDQNEEDDKCNGDINSATKAGVLTNAHTGNTSSRLNYNQ